MEKEKYIVRVIRKREYYLKQDDKNSTSVSVDKKVEQVDQIYEQEFDKFDIGEFAISLNKRNGQEKDEKALKMNDNTPNSTITKAVS